jgi:hypothetical protein
MDLYDEPHADGRIVEDRDYLDKLALLQQLGALPADSLTP